MRHVCEVLYTSMADPTILNHKGQPALHLAGRAALQDVLLWLAGRVSRAVLCLRDARGVTALDYARHAGVRADALKRLEQISGITSRPGQGPLALDTLHTATLFPGDDGQNSEGGHR